MNQTSHSLAGPRPRIARDRRLHALRWMWALAVSVLSACGGDGTVDPEPVEPVAAVTLTGAPTDVVLAGSTVQLTATPVSAAGAALPGRTVTWQSSDPGIATVGATGVVNVAGAGSVTVTATSEGKVASATLDARAGGQLGPQGGTLQLLGGKITVSAFAGAFPYPLTVLFRPAVSAPQNPRSVPGTTWEMEPYVMSAFPPPLLTLAYDPALLPGGVTEAGLQLYQVVDGSWRPVFGSVADTAQNTVRGFTGTGGTYTVAAGVPSTVAIDGALAGGALYVGQTRGLKAAALDVRGDTLRGQTIAWATSDPARATVDAAGNVTGHGVGTVTLTATAEGVQGATTVTVLARPVASWNGAEWATLQGNARHDGHVNATLDPMSFRELWVKPVAEFPRSAATGAGRVFVSTGLSSNVQLTAYDATTGAVSWSRTFPGATLISSPAFANGRVYVLMSGALWSFDAVDGTVRFTQPYTDYHLFAPPPVVAAGGVFLGGSSTSNGGVRRFDALTGAQTWQVPLVGMDGQTPAVAEGRVLAYGTVGSMYGDGLTALNAADGSVAYNLPTPVLAAIRTPVLGGAGNVLTANGLQLASMRLQSGDVAWSQPGSYPTLPAVGNGVVYAVRGNDVVAFRESDGAPLWTWTPRRGTPSGPPLVTDNLLFISTQISAINGPTLYVTDAIDLATGKQVWSHPAGGFLALGADGTLFIIPTTTPGGPAGTLTAIAVK